MRYTLKVARMFNLLALSSPGLGPADLLPAAQTLVGGGHLLDHRVSDDADFGAAESSMASWMLNAGTRRTNTSVEWSW